jgi:hypothetical protein
MQTPTLLPPHMTGGSNPTASCLRLSSLKPKDLYCFVQSAAWVLWPFEENLFTLHNPTFLPSLMTSKTQQTGVSSEADFELLIGS